MTNKLIETLTGKAGESQPAKSTYIALVLDESGSMYDILEQAQSAVEEQIKAIQENADKGGETFVTLVPFSTSVMPGVPLTPAADVRAPKLRALASTALNDGIAEAINRIDARMPTEGDHAALVVVISDGYENSSRTTQQTISNRIKELEQTGKWTFMFQLANVDIHEAQVSYGAQAGNMASWTSDHVGTQRMGSLASVAHSHYLTARAAGQTSVADLADQAEDSVEEVA